MTKKLFTHTKRYRVGNYIQEMFFLKKKIAIFEIFVSLQRKQKSFKKTNRQAIL